MKRKREPSAKMSRSALKEDSTISAIGRIDQATIATRPIAFRIESGSLPMLAEHLLVQPAQIEQRKQERGEHEQPAGRGGCAEGVVAERFEIEINRQHLGAACRPATGHQPDLGEQPEREDVAEQSCD